MDAVPDPIKMALEHLEQGILASKCHFCGCQQGTVRALKRSAGLLTPAHREQVLPALERAEATFKEQRYDCLGCTVCYPSLMSQELSTAYPNLALEEGCAADLGKSEERRGWPPVPGNYAALRYQAPVAVCTLNSAELLIQLKAKVPAGLSMVGTLHTENLGIERIIRNVQANPNIRHLVVAGRDTEQKIGHLPGASLLSLFTAGVDKAGRIVGAPGRRPVLKNIKVEDVERFRRQVQVLDLIGREDVGTVLEAIQRLATTHPPVFGEAMAQEPTIETVDAVNTQPLVIDEKGYFVIDSDDEREEIRVEHYSKDGVLDTVVRGKDISAIYMTALERGLLSRMDHACYLGKELARAEAALAGGQEYVQDRAQEPGGKKEGGHGGRSKKECC